VLDLSDLGQMDCQWRKPCTAPSAAPIPPTTAPLSGSPCGAHLPDRGSRAPCPHSPSLKALARSGGWSGPRWPRMIRAAPAPPAPGNAEQTKQAGCAATKSRPGLLGAPTPMAPCPLILKRESQTWGQTSAYPGGTGEARTAVDGPGRRTRDPENRQGLSPQSFRFPATAAGSPRQVQPRLGGGQLLNHSHGSPQAAVFRFLRLPVLGVDGSLAENRTGPTARGRVMPKTAPRSFHGLFKAQRAAVPAPAVSGGSGLPLFVTTRPVSSSPCAGSFRGIKAVDYHLIRSWTPDPAKGQPGLMGILNLAIRHNSSATRCSAMVRSKSALVAPSDGVAVIWMISRRVHPPC